MHLKLTGIFRKPSSQRVRICDRWSLRPTALASTAAEMKVIDCISRHAGSFKDNVAGRAGIQSIDLMCGLVLRSIC